MPSPFLAVAAAATVIGTGISYVGQRKAAKAEEAARKAQAKALEEQAAEMVRRAKINAEIIRTQGRQFEGQLASAQAKGGVELGTGSALQQQVAAATAYRVAEARFLYDAERDADLVRQGAQIQRDSATATRQAQELQSYGTILQGIGSVGSMYAGHKGSGNTSGTGMRSAAPSSIPNNAPIGGGGSGYNNYL